MAEEVKMKTKEERCSVCGEDTIHDVGMKQAHKGDKHHIRRSTSRCRKCGTKVINNRAKGKRTIIGRN